MPPGRPLPALRGAYIDEELATGKGGMAGAGRQGRERRKGHSDIKKDDVGRSIPRYSSGMPPYERFHAWKACDELAVAIYEATRLWPQSERFGLTAQARSAAFSAAANIVEGSAKLGPREFRRFLGISLGSLAELSYTIRFAHRVGIISEEEWRRLENLRNQAGRLTWFLCKSLKPPK